MFISVAIEAAMLEDSMTSHENALYYKFLTRPFLTVPFAKCMPRYNKQILHLYRHRNCIALQIVCCDTVRGHYTNIDIAIT